MHVAQDSRGLFLCFHFLVCDHIFCLASVWKWKLPPEPSVGVITSQAISVGEGDGKERLVFTLYTCMHQRLSDVCVLHMCSCNDIEVPELPFNREQLPSDLFHHWDKVQKVTEEWKVMCQTFMHKQWMSTRINHTKEANEYPLLVDALNP